MKQICDLALFRNCVNCGVLVIAFAVDILNGFTEIGKRFDVGKMRSFLKCLEE